MTEVLWAEPPPPGRAKKSARPAALSLAASIRKGNRGFGPAGDFEPAVRRDAQMLRAGVVHSWFVYVRYVGGETP